MRVNTDKMRNRILELVKKDPRVINDDKLLIAAIWWYEGWKDEKLYENLQKVSTPGTITRTRRKLVEEGLIKPNVKAQQARGDAEQQVLEDLGY